MINNVLQSGIPRRIGERFLITVSCGLLIILGLIYLSFYNFLLFHTMIETICIVIGILITIIAVNTYKFNHNDSLLFLGIAYFFVAFFDFFHTVTYKGIGIFLSYDADLPTQLWIIARYIESVSLFILSISFGKRLRVSVVTFVYVIISGVLFLTVFYWDIFPNCFIEGVGLTFFKKTSEYIISFILLMGLLISVKNKERFSTKVFLYMVLTFISTIISELLFIFYIDVYGLSNMMGHIFKLLSFYYIYKCIVETNLIDPYILVQTANLKLEKKTKELEIANKSLQDENRQRKEVQKNLFKKREILNAILDSIEEGILVVDKSGKIVHTNDRFATMWKIPKEVLCQNDDKELIDFVRQQLKDPHEFSTKIDEIVGANNANMDYIEFKNGCVFERGFKPLIIHDIVSGYVWSFRDITENLKLTKSLEESEARYRTVVEAIPEGIGVMHDGKYTYANEALAQMLNISSPEELIGRKIDDFSTVDKDYELEVRKRTKDVIEGNKNVPFLEQRIIRWDGSTFDAEAAAFPLKQDLGKSMVVVVRDISVSKQKEALQKEVEEKQSQLEEERTLNKMTTQFFSTISHELKTPLNVILGTIQLLDISNISSEFNHTSNSLYKYIRIMKQNCYRLLRLINNLIDITKLDSGFLQMNYSKYNIVNVVENITLSVAEYTKSKGIDLVFDTSIEEKNIDCDADKIERIILNLLSNAIKYTEPEGRIEVNITDEDDSILISVKDTGIGIPEDMLEKIFDRFRQVDSSLSRKAEGSGIGLSLVKSLVELHGGKIYINSQIGKGSEFIVKIPVREQDHAYGTYEEVAVTTEVNVERISIEFSDIYEI